MNFGTEKAEFIYKIDCSHNNSQCERADDNRWSSAQFVTLSWCSLFFFVVFLLPSIVMLRCAIVLFYWTHTSLVWPTWYRVKSVWDYCRAARNDSAYVLNAYRTQSRIAQSWDECIQVFVGHVTLRGMSVCVCLCKIFHKSCRLNDFIDGIQSCLFDSKHSLTRTNARHTKKY